MSNCFFVATSSRPTLPAVAEDTMAGENPPHLLTLPREIRDLIYAELHRSIELTIPEDSINVAEIELNDAPLAELFGVCKQVRYEYQEVSLHHKSITLYPRAGYFDASTVKLKHGVPTAIFQTAKHVTVKLSYYRLDKRIELGGSASSDIGQYRQFRRLIVDHRLIADGADEVIQTRPWTPSKAVAQLLGGMVKGIEELLIPATATILLDIYKALIQKRAWVRTPHGPTFADFDFTRGVHFSNVSIQFRIVLPVCSFRVDCVHDDPSHLTESPTTTRFKRGGRTRAYRTADSKQWCKWIMVPTSTQPRCETFYGFVGLPDPDEEIDPIEPSSFRSGEIPPGDGEDDWTTATVDDVVGND